ncbi:hypothetical protein Q7P37_000664 [Cladosporium fusiforme]
MATQLLTNDFLGPAYSLQIQHHSRINSLHAAPSRDGGLFWAIVPSPEDPGRYNICTTYSGQPKCLDIYNDCSHDRTRVCLADPGYYSGQAWRLEPQGESRYKLSNDWTGPGWYLDTYSDSHEAFMSQGDFSGQLWLVSVPSPTAGGYCGTQDGSTQVPVPVYHDAGVSNVGQHHGSSAGKIAGRLGAAYVAHKGNSCALRQDFIEDSYNDSTRNKTTQRPTSSRKQHSINQPERTKKKNRRTTSSKWQHHHHPSPSAQQPSPTYPPSQPSSHAPSTQQTPTYKTSSPPPPPSKPGGPQSSPQESPSPSPKTSHLLTITATATPSETLGILSLHLFPALSPGAGFYTTTAPTPSHDIPSYAAVESALASARQELMNPSGRAHFAIELFGVDDAFKGQGLGKQLPPQSVRDRRRSRAGDFRDGECEREGRISESGV